jgi:hypothetical protein
MIAQDPVYCYEKVQTFLDKLNSNSYANKEELISVMMELVPEFIQTSQELK